MFPTETYVQRRHVLMQALESGLVLFPGNRLSPMNYTSNPYPFRQDSNFLYYFGLDAPGLDALIDLDEGISMLFGASPSLDDIIWEGPAPSIEEKAARVGVEQVAPPNQLGKLLKMAKKQGRPVFYLPPYQFETTFRLHNWIDIPIKNVPEQASVPLIQAVVQQRSCKSAEEVAALNLAVDLTGQMHLQAMQCARAGMLEAEVAGQAQAVALCANGELSFPMILSTRGEILHNHRHDQELQEGKLLLVDAGASAPNHYAGDMTRTFPVSKAFSPQQQEIYQLVLDAQRVAVEALRPGVPYRDIHLKSALTLTRGLLQLGIMKGDPEEAVAAGAHALFFPHGLGHMMGLDVHDMEGLGEDYVGYTASIARSHQFGLAALRLGRELETGFVITVEPGLYFIPALMDRWKSDRQHGDFINYAALEAYRNFGGVRIEDDYLITPDGARLLGNPVPKSVAEVEAVRAQAIGG